ncbi:MAG: undecaprenyl/decaprenyl-phosphate alpha-N-acetylglucosaminyl 1-phosphate transferase [Solirubrobacterales bacterium]|nr:undecaprenyl/decaprenyl-phosphate alpha-N-acetylglucosaminyl 1-phosphate transferase [Solirubrobacterales bacterium]
MPDTIDALFALAAAAGIAWLLVPVAEALAWRIGAIDLPRERSLHVAPTPKLSGMAILIAVCAAGAIFLPWDDETRAILIGAVAIACVGIVDDLIELPPLVKLVGQIASAIIPVSAGVTVDVFTLPFLGGVDPAAHQLFDLPLVGNVDLGELGTVVGIVAMANVINLIDGVDGLAAGVCLISAATLALVALSLQRNSAGVLAAITAGAALGFLRHGLPPASSFMGDTGSNLLGYLLGVAAVQGALKTNAVVALAFPMLVLAVPILDTGFVIAKRLKYRRPIYKADAWHFHHRMANIGFSQGRTLAYLYAWTLVMAGVALALRFVPYSDDRGNFDTTWTAVMIAILVLGVAASFYVIYVLEILKLRRFRFRQVAAKVEAPEPEDVDREVAHELETGRFREPDPDTGEFQRPGGS